VCCVVPAAAEVVIHGEPSGLDNTTSCFGGAVRLNRTLGRFETLPMLPDMNILLTNTNIPRSAKKLVGHVRTLHETFPTVLKPILESIEGISQEFLRLIDP
jgi:mevalonate kinase